MSTLGIVVALAAEQSTLAELANDGSVLIRCGGPGPTAADAAARALVDDGCDRLLSWGVAGGLAPALHPGDLILADAVIDDAGRRWHCDCPLPLNDVVRGTIAGSEHALLTPAAKAERHRRDGCLAVDMESAAIAAVAERAGLPFAALRAVADPATRSIPYAALNAVDAHGRSRPLRLLGGVLRRPLELARLIPLARDFGRARRALTRAANALRRNDSEADPAPSPRVRSNQSPNLHQLEFAS